MSHQSARSHPSLPKYPGRERLLKIATWIVTIAVLGLVALMRQVKLRVPDGWDVSYLPGVNAGLNALTAVALVASLYFVKQGRYRAHRNANFAALGLSVLFLLCYVAYHFTTGEVIFGDVDGDGVLSLEETAAVGGTRMVYLLILASHIILAAVLLPFILLTAVRALVGKYALHVRMARVVWPLWLYVAVTGPVVYLMLRPYYSS